MVVRLSSLTCSFVTIFLFASHPLFRTEYVLVISSDSHFTIRTLDLHFRMNLLVASIIRGGDLLMTYLALLINVGVFLK